MSRSTVESRSTHSRSLRAQMGNWRVQAEAASWVPESRGRNLGQTVENIQEKTERYPRNFINFKEISIIIIFKIFLHKQMIWFKDLENNKILSVQFYSRLSAQTADCLFIITGREKMLWNVLWVGDCSEKLWRVAISDPGSNSRIFHQVILPDFLSFISWITLPYISQISYRTAVLNR